MAVTAVDAVVADVVEMAELYGLLDVLLRASDVGRPSENDEQADEPTCKDEYADNTGAREGISAAVEDLWHQIVDIRGVCLANPELSVRQLDKVGIRARVPIRTCTML